MADHDDEPKRRWWRSDAARGILLAYGLTLLVILLTVAWGARWLLLLRDH